MVGIDDENYRIYDDTKEPVLYPKHLFKVTDGTIPDDWVRTDVEDGEFYIESPITSSDGFYEKYFDGDEKIKLKMAAIIASSPYCYADVLGIWKVDVDMTLNFNNKYTQLSEPEVQLLKCFSENSFFEIEERSFIFSMNEHKCTIAGTDTNIDAFRAEYQYRVLYENEKISFLISKLEDGTDFSQTLHRVDDNLLWIYYAGENPEYDSHIRHYYKKIESTDSISK